MGASRIVPGLTLVLVLVTGCTRDPMNGTDGISPFFGLSEIHNANVHIIDPNAGYRATANPGASGKRAAGVIEGYLSYP